VDFSLSEEQEMIRSTARKFLEKECPSKLVREMEEDGKGYSVDLWHKMAELGWMALPLSGKYGGYGCSFLDLAILLEEMGRACLPSPFIPTVVLGGLTILDMGSEEQKSKFLPGISKGDTILTLALLEPSDSYEPSAILCQAIAHENGYLITGNKLFVSDAQIADYFMVATITTNSIKAEHGITLFLVDANSPGISYTPLKTMAGDKQCEVNFDNVKVPHESVLGEVGGAWKGIKRMLERASIAKCAEMVGGAQQVLEMTVDYAKQRVQFGRPIGSFQAIHHYCANMATDVDASRFNTYHAAWMIDEGLPCSNEIAIAKAWVSEAYYRITMLSHQIYGAIAWTKDLDLELYIRRAKAAEVAFGNADFHREVIAQGLGLSKAT
jgi:alkylation response protein AidB-like acyl-CoA dehydrogenase